MTDTDLAWRTYGGFSGPNIPGSEQYVLSLKHKTSHLHRAFWLASMVETSARFGAVNGYDGCGMTCGLDQKVAVLPKTMAQGALWRVIRVLWDHNPNLEVGGILPRMLQDQGWVVAPDGVLRNLRTGNLVQGNLIREALTPPRGMVPKAGPDWERSKAWALAFRDLFGNPVTFPSQVTLGIENLVQGQNRLEVQAYKTRTGLTSPLVLVPGKTITHTEDLAFCVYHAYSVHAPSVAAAVLRERVRKDLGKPPEEFARNLIKDFGTHPYKRWRDQPDNKASRYDRTRVHALRSGLWDGSFFASGGLMPENL